MSLFTILKATFVASFISSIAASPVASLNKDLRPLLSPNAAIYYPGSEGYTNATNRWSADTKPGLEVVVKVADEKDVQATVSSIFPIHALASVTSTPSLRSKLQLLTCLIRSNTPTPTQSTSSPSMAAMVPPAILTT